MPRQSLPGTTNIHNDISILHTLSNVIWLSQSVLSRIFLTVDICLSKCHFFLDCNVILNAYYGHWPSLLTRYLVPSGPAVPPPSPPALPICFVLVFPNGYLARRRLTTQEWPTLELLVQNGTFDIWMVFRRISIKVVSNGGSRHLNNTAKIQELCYCQQDH